MTNATEVAAAPGAARRVGGDLNIVGGRLRHEGALEIAGSIGDGMEVEAAGRVTVGGSIGGSEVRAGADLCVAGNIVSRRRGSCLAGGGVTFRIANGATIEAAGDVTAGVEVVGSRVVTFGRFSCENGSVYGGRITAAGGISCAVLGSPAGIPTVAEAGLDERLRRLGRTRGQEVLRNRAKIHRVRIDVAKLLTHLKDLTPAQKESATEMLFEADTLETRTNALVADLRRLLAAMQARTRPEVVVTRMLHAGVTLRFAGVESVVRAAVPGPVRVWLKPLGLSHQAMITHVETGVTELLTTATYEDEDLSALQKAVDPEAPAGKRAA